MGDPEIEAWQRAEQSYAAALAQVAQPTFPAAHSPADPYGRTLTLVDGDFAVAPGPDGPPDFRLIAGKEELAQGLQVLIGTPQGSDIFNVAFGFDLLKTLALPRTARETR